MPILITVGPALGCALVLATPPAPATATANTAAASNANLLLVMSLSLFGRSRSRHTPTVDRDDAAIHVRRLRRGEKGNERRYLIRLAKAAGWDLREQLRRVSEVVQVRRRHPCPHIAGTDG